jgi:hypothetical protein
VKNIFLVLALAFAFTPSLRALIRRWRIGSRHEKDIAVQFCSFRRRGGGDVSASGRCRR